MSIKNHYIFVESSLESELVQTLLLEAGACWPLGGRKILPINNCIIAINDNLEMFYSDVDITLGNYEELSIDELVEIVQRDAPVGNDNTVYICEVVDNHISFEGTEVALTPDELSEVLRVIKSLPHRDFEITTSDGDERVFPLANLTINFK